MPGDKETKSKPKLTGTKVGEIERKKILPLKWMGIFPKNTIKCPIRRPRYARIIDVHYTRHRKGLRALNRVKSMRLLSLRVYSYAVIPKYKGELTQLLLKTHYLKKFHFQFYLVRDKDVQTLRKLILRQKRLQCLALLNNWGKLSRFTEGNNLQVQIRMIHKVGRHLRKLVLGNIISKIGHYFRPEYLPKLKFCVFSATCRSLYNPFPRYTGWIHGRLAKKLLSMPSLRKWHIRSCPNFIDMSFWKAIRYGLIKRDEPIRMNFSCGLWGYDDPYRQNREMYEKDVKKTMEVLKPNQILIYRSSYNVFTLGEKKKPERKQQEAPPEIRRPKIWLMKKSILMMNIIIIMMIQKISLLALMKMMIGMSGYMRNN